MAATPVKTLRVFYSYAREDKEYRQQLEKHLSNILRLYRIQTWFNRLIRGGERWEAVLNDRLNTADLILLLISADFLASDYCYNQEMRRALERDARGEARIIPIIVRRVHWEKSPFSHLQALPLDGEPVDSSSWDSRDDAYYHIAVEIEKAIQDLLAFRATQEVAPPPYMPNIQEVAPPPHMPRMWEVMPPPPVPNMQGVAPPPQVPDMRAKWFGEGKVLQKTGRYEEAVQAYEQAIQLDSSFAAAYQGRGAALFHLKHYEEALQAYEQAMSLDPGFALAFYSKGVTLEKLKRYEEALQAYEQLIRLAPNALAYQGKGTALSRLEQYEEAVQAYEQAMRLDPNSSQAPYGKGVALEKLKRYEEALQAYEQAIQLDSSFAAAYQGKGSALSHLKHDAEAREAARIARELGY